MDKSVITQFIAHAIIIMALFTNIVSHNTGGLGGINKVMLKDMLEDTHASICLLQETWLLNKDLDVLSSIHDDYLGVGKSAVPDNSILIGRPFGGVAILWQSSLATHIVSISIESNRICGIIITVRDIRYLVLNVYLPVDSRNMTHISEEFEKCLDELELCLNEHCVDYILIGGDFNTDFSRSTAQTRCLNDFIQRNNLLNGWLTQNTNGIMHDNVSTFRDPNGFHSCIDHFLFSRNVLPVLRGICAIEDKYYVKDTGHFPIALEFNNDVFDSSFKRSDSVSRMPKIAWHKINDYYEYSHLIEGIMHDSGDLAHLSGISCSDRTCRDPSHLCDVDFVCKILTDMCIDAADVTLPKVGTHKVVPFWNDNIKPLKISADFWYHIWRSCGRPQLGIVYDIYKKCRHAYHYAIRDALRDRCSSSNRRMAESIATNNSRDLWREIKKMKYSANKRAPHIDGITGSENIAALFADKYNELYNSVPSDIYDIIQHINENIENDSEDDYSVRLDIIDKAISKLKSEKSDGDKGLWSNLVINAPLCWKMILAKLLRSMMIHGHMADDLLLSTISSLPKNLASDICNSKNYRGIALTSSLNKVLDWVIILKHGDLLETSNLQFAYKKNHSMSMCTLSLKEVVKYYTDRRGQVYCCFIDATKAFDRIRFDKLFNILIKRGLPMCIVRLIIDMYQRQKVRTTWNGHISNTFETINGVRQGGVLSPLLFSVYIDVLLMQLEKSGYGCHIGHEYYGVLGSADDISLLAPTVYALKKMLAICEDYGAKYDVTYNPTKTVCIYFSGKRRYNADPIEVHLNGKKLSWVKNAKHLGNFISWNLSEECEINAKISDFIGRTNSLLANFKGVDRSIVSNIFRSQCYHLYGCQAWSLGSKYIDKFDVTWRKAVRKLWYIPNIARSSILPELVNVLSLRSRSIQLFSNMYNIMCESRNTKIKLLCQVSVYSEKKGIIGQNVSIVSKHSLCGHDILHFREAQCEDEMKSRAISIMDITSCLEGSSYIENFSVEELVMLKNYIACY